MPRLGSRVRVSFPAPKFFNQKAAQFQRGFLVLPSHTLAEWQNGHAAACKAVYAGSIPTSASISTSKAIQQSPQAHTVWAFFVYNNSISYRHCPPLKGYQGAFVTKAALGLAPLVFVRPGELRQAEWAEFDLDKAEWRIPGEKMKMRDPHIVPLSSQAVAILRELHPMTGGGRYFPSARTPHGNRCISENAILAALRRMGYGNDEMTGHGFRSMASTLLNEQGWHRDAIERQLAHAERNAVRAAYNYAEHLPERRKMMQAWSDYLEGLKKGADVIPIKRAG